MKREIADYDRYTEVKDNVTERLVPAITLIRHKWSGARFFMGFQDAFVELALARKRLGPEALTVLLLLLGKVEYNNLIKIRQVEIAKILGMRKQNVSRAIAKLVKEKIVMVDRRNEKYKREMMLNDEYAWKGKLKHAQTRHKVRQKQAAKKDKEEAAKKKKEQAALKKEEIAKKKREEAARKKAARKEAADKTKAANKTRAANKTDDKSGHEVLHRVDDATATAAGDS